MEEQDKTEWKIQIEGDEKYIDDLNSAFETLCIGPIFNKEEDGFYLETDLFKGFIDAKDLSEKAKTFLALLPNLPYFKSSRNIETLKVAEIVEITETGDKKITKKYDENGNLGSSEIISGDKKDITLDIQSMTLSCFTGTADVLAEDGKKIIGGLYTIESIKDFAYKNKDTPEELKKAKEYLEPFIENLKKFANTSSNEKQTIKMLTFLFNLDLVNTETNIETLKWVILYKIYEVIADGVDGEHELYKRKWLNKEKISHFTCTANAYRHAENKDCKEIIEKQGLMPLSEGREVVSQLLEKYVDEKSKKF